MAGIGFVLRKLASQDNFSGILRAYIHASVAAVGPWILIVLVIGIILTFSSNSTMSLEELNEFLSVFIYNLCFSFMLAGPLYMLSARYVSDCLYMRDLAPIPGIMVITLLYLVIPAALLATFVYVYFATMTPLTTLLSIINFTLFCQIWVTMLYLAMIRDFRAITFSWVVGMLLAVILALYLGGSYRTDGILAGINVGLCLLVSSLTAHTLAEHPYRYQKPKNFPFYARFYRGVYWGGFFLFASMWVDKVIMWNAPEAVKHINSLVTYPVYDGGMFLSYLSIVPVMGLFIFNLETNFYDSYIQYIRYIETNTPLFLLEEERKTIIAKILEDARSFLVLQGVITLLVVIFAPAIYDWLNQDFRQLSIFRLGAVGAFFSSLCFFIVVIFTYFDSQENSLKVTMTMFFSNVVFSYISLYLGFPFYGYGFCFAMIFSFFVAATLFMNFLQNLHYHIFISNTVKRQKIRERFLHRPGL